MLYKVVLILKSYDVTIQMKAILGGYFPVVLFITLYKDGLASCLWT